MKFDLIKAVLLGALQGFTEFIPVSSSGHLLVARNLMGIGHIPKLFDVLMHIPTLLVVLLVFRKIITRLFLSLVHAVRMGFRKEKIDDTVWTDLKLILIVLITSIITVVLAVAIDHYDDVFEASPRYVGILFVITGSILIISKFFAGEKGYKEIGLQSGIIAGIAQGLGVLPGISRSGITISAALFLGIKREKAGEFSFLIAIPAILGAFLFKLNDTQKMVIQPFDLIAGLVVCFFVGLGSLVLLIKLVEQRKFYLFSIYLIPAGIATLIFL